MTPEHDLGRLWRHHRGIHRVQSHRHDRQTRRRGPKVETLEATKRLTGGLAESANESRSELDFESDESRREQGRGPEVGWDQVGLQRAKRLSRHYERRRKSGRRI